MIDRRRNRRNPKDSKGRMIAGVIILIAGLLFMFSNFNMIPPQWEYYIFSWKTLIIGIGVLNILFSHNRNGGFIMIVVGLAFWIPEIFTLTLSAGKMVFPLAVIAVGVFLLFNSSDKRFGNRFWRRRIGEQKGAMSDDEESDSEDYVDDMAVFGGGSRVVTSKNFKGGKLTAIFGGSEIRMHHAKLAPGDQVLDVFFLFGGSELIVPSDWVINVEVISIFGGFGDKRYVSRLEDFAGEKPSSLTIKGLVLFGGAGLKTY